MFAGVFGLVHGAGFANYLRACSPARSSVPLFGFNVGIELGQLVVLAPGRRGAGRARPGAGAASGRRRPSPSAYRLRVVAVAASWSWWRPGMAAARRPLVACPLPRLALLGARARRGAGAHPMHTAVAELAQQDAGRRPTVQIRVFADDFQAAVAAAGRRRRGDSAMARYLRGTFALADRRAGRCGSPGRAPSGRAT